jgi:hypothetical protein
MKNQKPVKLTPAMLRGIIEEEVGKFGDMEDVEDKSKDTEETEADEFADSLDKHIDFMKALKIEESRLVRRLGKVRETKARAMKSLAKKI